jgi:FtsZ-interacting cell division protein YlmF
MIIKSIRKESFILKKFMKLLGFEDEEPGEYRRKKPAHAAREEIARSNAYNSNYEDYGDDEKYERPFPIKNGLILFKGLPSTEDKLQLREALLGGCIILLDLSGIPSERIEEGRQFITFMHGVSFANNGEFLKLAPRIFSVSPHPGMVLTMTGTSTAKKQGDEA